MEQKNPTVLERHDFQIRKWKGQNSLKKKKRFLAHCKKLRAENIQNPKARWRGMYMANLLIAEMKSFLFDLAVKCVAVLCWFVC